MDEYMEGRTEEHIENDIHGGGISRSGHIHGGDIHIYGLDIYMEGTYAWGEIHMGGRYTWRGHTHGEDIHVEGTYIWRGHTQVEIHVEGTYTWRGHTRGGDIHMEGKYTEGTYTWRGHTHEGERRMERTHMEGTYTWMRHTHGRDIQAAANPTVRLTQIAKRYMRSKRPTCSLYSYGTYVPEQNISNLIM